MEQKGYRIFHMTVNSVKCSRGFQRTARSNVRLARSDVTKIVPGELKKPFFGSTASELVTLCPFLHLPNNSNFLN
jgi:hypothetical protein